MDKWIIDCFGYTCPKCGFVIDNEVDYLYSNKFKLNFCPNCGVRLGDPWEEQAE